MRGSLVLPYAVLGLFLLVLALDRRGARSEVTVGMPVQVAHAAPAAAGAVDVVSTVGRDPVCRMDVDDRLAAVYRGERYVFCMDACRDAFLADPEAYARENCLVCRADDRLVAVADDAPALTWQGVTHRFCGAEHKAAFAADPAGYFLHSMWGIPGWLYACSVAFVLVLSFGLFELIARRSRERALPAPRLDLFRIPGVRRALRSPLFRLCAQVVFVGAFALVVLAGLFGDQIATNNVAPLLTWTLWWGGLVLVILIAGKAWCYVCPWDALAGWVERIPGLGTLGLRWPRALRSIWPATALFVGLTWLEIGFGVTMSPRATAMLGLAMLTLAVLSALLFERKAFCRYACLVGRVSGLYALFAASEVRPVDRAACKSCATKDCYHGNERGVGCPTGVFPGALTENTYCIDCMACVRTCPTENMTVRARPWGADLEGEVRPRRDEAYLALLMLAITGFHGLTMTGVWRDLLGGLEARLGLGHVAAFTLAMTGLMIAPIAVYALLVRASVLLARAKDVDFSQAFVRFAYSVLPIALFYHLAHNLEHLLMEGQRIVPLLSNPFGFAPGERWSILGLSGTGAWNLLGTADWTPAPLVRLPTLWLLQVLLVLIGHVYSLWIADRTARRLFPARGAAFRSQLPMLLGMVLFSIFSLWLLKQPMEMRTSAM